MKKIMLILLLLLITMTAIGAPRSYFQKVACGEPTVNVLTLVTSTLNTYTAPNYTVSAYITLRPTEVISIDVSPTTSIRLCKAGNGTTVPYYAVVFVQLGDFTTWAAGETIHTSVTKTDLSSNNEVSWDLLIPTGTTAINMNVTAQTIPPLAGVDPKPATATTPTPADDTTNVLLATNQVSWSFLHNTSYTDPTGFKVYFDTINPPVNQLTNVNGTTGTFSSPIPALQNGTTYYWKIVPFNGGGDAINCPVWSFTTIQSTVADVTFSIPSATYQTAQDVILSTVTAGAVIHYTIDGSEPNEASATYINPIHIPLNTTMEIKAKAFKTDWIPSTTTSQLYAITGQVTLTQPIFSPPAGTYSNPQTVAINTITFPADAVLRYTTDNNDPTEASAIYVMPLQITEGSTTIKVKAFKTNWTPSDLQTASYTIFTILDAPILTASFVDNSIVLNWNAVSGATSYNIYGSDALNGTYSLLGQTVINTYQPTNYTLPTGNNTVLAHYYITAGRVESAPSDIVSVAITRLGVVGLNLVGIPFIPASYMASSLAESGNIDMIAGWDASLQNWNVAINLGGWFDNDFELTPGMVCFMDNMVAGTYCAFTTTGSYPAYSIDIVQGYNFILFPVHNGNFDFLRNYCYDDPYWETDPDPVSDSPYELFLAMGSAIESISQWDANEQYWQQYLPNSYSNDWGTLLPNHCYAIYSPVAVPNWYTPSRKGGVK